MLTLAKLFALRWNICAITKGYTLGAVSDMLMAVSSRSTKIGQAWLSHVASTALLSLRYHRVRYPNTSKLAGT